MTEQCGACRFWLQWPDTYQEEPFGMCLRYPPIINPTINDRKYARGDRNPFDQTHPRTLRTDWCGEFSPKSERRLLPSNKQSRPKKSK